MCAFTYISKVVWNFIIQFIFDNFLQRYYGNLQHPLMMGILQVSTLGQISLHILYEVWTHVLQIPFKVFDDFLRKGKCGKK